MSQEYSTSAVAVEVLWTLLQKHGLGQSRLTAITGIDPEQLQGPDRRVTLESYLKLWRCALEHTADPLLALRLPTYYDDKQMHFVANILLQSSTFHQVLQQWLRYSTLVCDADKLSLHSDDRYTTLTYNIIAPRHQNPWIPELYFSLLARHMSKSIAAPYCISTVYFSHKCSADTKAYTQVFNAPVVFEHSDNSIRWSNECLDLPLRTHDPYYQEILQNYADSLLGSGANDDSFATQVREKIIQKIPEGKADAINIAESFHMDRRTLLRRLKQENWTFKALLDDTRKQLACAYMEQNLSFTEISYLLGFNERSSFHSAFRRWFKLSPGEYRLQQTK